MKLLRWFHFKWAYIVWFFGIPGYRYGDPKLNRNSKDIISNRYLKAEPKREDFNL